MAVFCSDDLNSSRFCFVMMKRSFLNALKFLQSILRQMILFHKSAPASFLLLLLFLSITNVLSNTKVDFLLSVIYPCDITTVTLKLLFLFLKPKLLKVFFLLHVCIYGPFHPRHHHRRVLLFLYSLVLYSLFTTTLT